MNEKEYREFLEAVARRHLRLHRVGRWFGPEGVDRLLYEIDRLSGTARLVNAVAERADNSGWYQPLSQELKRTYVQHITEIMVEAGVTEALDEYSELIFANLNRDVIPDEDIELLRQAGVREPEAEVTIAIQYARRLGKSQDLTPSRALEQAAQRMKEVVSTLAQAEENKPSSETPKKPKKYFTGIGRILSGAIAGAGNLLIGIGSIPASGGAATAGVIASSALAVGLVSQGIGDLCGE